MNVTNANPCPDLRVRLTMGYNHFRCTAHKLAAETAFGPKIKDVFNCSRDTQITCRPDQFAIFMVERNRLGGQNGYKDLHVKLVNVPAFLAPTMDVSDYAYG